MEQLLDGGRPYTSWDRRWEGEVLLLLRCFTGSWVSAIHWTFLRLQHLSGSIQWERNLKREALTWWSDCIDLTRSLIGLFNLLKLSSTPVCSGGREVGDDTCLFCFLFLIWGISHFRRVVAVVCHPYSVLSWDQGLRFFHPFFPCLALCSWNRNQVKYPHSPFQTLGIRTTLPLCLSPPSDVCNRAQSGEGKGGGRGNHSPHPSNQKQDLEVAAQMEETHN